MSGILVIAGTAPRRAASRIPGTRERGAGLRRAGEQIAVAILGAAPDDFVKALSVAGADEIVTVKVTAAEFDPDTFESAVGALIAARSPELVLVAHSVDSFGYAAALAARLGLGFATDVFKAERIDGELVATRAAMVKRSMSRWISPAAAPCCWRFAAMCSNPRRKPPRRASRPSIHPS